MIFGRCPDCKEIKFQTKHSESGNHQPPYIRVCRKCHDDRHGIITKPLKTNKKCARGTKRQHKRK